MDQRAKQPIEDPSKSAILLIQPPASFKVARPSLPDVHVSIGLLSLAASLRAAGHPVSVLHLGQARESGQDPQAVLAEALGAHPDVVGISLNWLHLTAGAMETAELVRRRLPDRPVLIGGHHASHFASELARLLADLDVWVVAGEGESALLQVAGDGEQVVPERIPGIHTARGGQGLAGPLPIQELPAYSYDDLVLPSADRLAALNTARGGCPRRCPYCAESCRYYTFRSGLEHKGTAQLLKQSLAFLDQGKDILTIQDPFLLMGESGVAAFCAGLAGSGRRFKEINVFAEPEWLSGSMIRSLAALPADLVSVDLGVETLSKGLLASMGRSYDLDLVHDRTLAMAKAGIACFSWWMTGLPGETDVEVEESAAALARLAQVGGIPRWVTPLLVLPGTDYYQRPEHWGIQRRFKSCSDFAAFSLVEHSPLGHYPQLVTHQTEDFGPEDVLRRTLRLKVAAHEAAAEALAAYGAQGQDALVRRLTRMLTDQPYAGFDMGSFM